MHKVERSCMHKLERFCQHILGESHSSKQAFTRSAPQADLQGGRHVMGVADHGGD